MVLIANNVKLCQEWLVVEVSSTVKLVSASVAPHSESLYQESSSPSSSSLSLSQSSSRAIVSTAAATDIAPSYYPSSTACRPDITAAMVTATGTEQYCMRQLLLFDVIVFI